MTDREALQIAFNALAAIDRETPYPIAKHAIKCINAVFNTQAQPEQEPVAWLFTYKTGQKRVFTYPPEQSGLKENCQPLYTAPPSKPWVSLTDEQINDIKGRWVCGEFESFADCLAAIEAALKERNT